MSLTVARQGDREPRTTWPFVRLFQGCNQMAAQCLSSAIAANIAKLPEPRLIGYCAAMQRAPDDVQPMTAEQAATLKRLATAA